MKCCTALSLLLLAFSSLHAQTTVQNFEGFADNTALSTQISGLTFTGSSVYTAGNSLNDAQYPPRSGVNVVTNTSGSSITITFATPVPTVNGYYTYSGSLTVQAFNSSSTLVATSTSAFSNNTVLNGVAGSHPNELISVSSGGGIASVTITSSAGATTFTLDDLTYGVIATVPALRLPAIGGLVFLLALLGCLAAGHKARAGGAAALVLLTSLSIPRPARANGAGATLVASPTVAPPGKSTPVTFTCTISGPLALANSVTLVRTDTTPQSVIGAMNLVSGSTYQLQLTITTPAVPTVIGPVDALRKNVTPASNQSYVCTVGDGQFTFRAKSSPVIIAGVNPP